jgi:hypothetical protein
MQLNEYGEPMLLVSPSHKQLQALELARLGVPPVTKKGIIGFNDISGSGFGVPPSVAIPVALPGGDDGEGEEEGGKKPKHLVNQLREKAEECCDGCCGES